MTDDTHLPLSSNPDLSKGIIRIPADSDIPVADLVKAREEGADVRVRGDGSVVISVNNPKSKEG